MIIEFEKRIAHYTEEINATVGEGASFIIEKLKFALGEVESLYAFYKAQMVDKGRIVPEQKTGGENAQKIESNVLRSTDGSIESDPVI